MRHKHADLIHKWAEGEEIQVCLNCIWLDDPFPSWNQTNEYRIKPKPIVRSGWVHVCRYDSYTRYMSSTIYSSKELALQNTPTNSIEIIKIEWEE